MNRTVKWLYAVAVCVLTLLPGSLQAQCGGTERWQVKVGTDTGVGNVDLTNPISISVQDLIQLPEPQRPPQGDNNTRLLQETHVYVVRGRLVKFRLETGATGDQDYHLVVSDSTLIFTDDNAGTLPGHSVVAEIPSPNCIPGKHGDPSVPSRFAGAIATSRQKLEARFPSIDPNGAFNDAGGILVEIVGVGFFDFPHHQIGRASNNIELHPILDIRFDLSGPPSPTPTISLVVNPGFESGEQAWVATPQVITDASAEDAHQGTWKAWLNGYGRTHTDTLYQQVSIPSTASTATLTFQLHIDTEEDNSQQKAFDTLKVQIRDDSGHLLQTLATFSNLDAGSGYNLKIFDLSAYVGRAIRVYFVGKEDNRKATSFVLDDFQLTIN